MYSNVIYITDDVLQLRLKPEKLEKDNNNMLLSGIRFNTINGN
jgi:hypothetical protein